MMQTSLIILAKAMNYSIEATKVGCGIYLPRAEKKKCGWPTAKIMVLRRKRRKKARRLKSTRRKTVIGKRV